MLKVINLWAGPGTGKSTTAAHLFYLMKSLGMQVELVTEYAKDVVYSEDFFRLKDQLYVFAKQHHRVWKLRDKVEWVIVDSPLPLGLVYAPDDMLYDYMKLSDFVISTYSKYDNYNFFLKRDNQAHPYQQYGRHQTLKESIEIDDKVMEVITAHNIPYTVLDVATAAESILRCLK